MIFAEWLASQRACKDALRWLASVREDVGEGDALNPDRVWALCQRGDWLLWWLGRGGAAYAQVSRQIALECADRAVRVYAPVRFDEAGLVEQAARLRALAPVVDEASARAAEAEAAEAEAAEWGAEWGAARAAAMAAAAARSAGPEGSPA